MSRAVAKGLAFVVLVLGAMAVIFWCGPRSSLVRFLHLRGIRQAVSHVQREIAIRRYWEPVTSDQFHMYRMCDSPDREIRMVGIEGLAIGSELVYPVLLSLLTDEDREVRKAAVDLVTFRFYTVSRSSTKMILLSMVTELAESDPELLDMKARALSRMTWGKFAYVPGESVSETRARAKAFLDVEKEELEGRTENSVIWGPSRLSK